MTIPHPARPDQSVQFFRDLERALRHLCDHVLAAPECHAWALVEPAIGLVVDPQDVDARWRAAEAALSGTGDATSSRLLELYAAAARAESADATGLAWHVSEGRDTLALGTGGVLLVVERDILRTAFVPGRGDPEKVRAFDSERRPRDESLRRERGMRAGRPGRTSREDPAHARRREGWSREERLYYEVFRPAVQFVRRSAYDAFDMRGRRVHPYGLLRRALPPMSRLGLEEWRERRASCRQEDR